MVPELTKRGGTLAGAAVGIVSVGEFLNSAGLATERAAGL